MTVARRTSQNVRKQFFKPNKPEKPRTSGAKSEWPSRCNAFAIARFLVYFSLLMTSHDVICSSEFVLFNNVIIFVLWFDKIAKLLLAIMIWLEETKESLILGMSLRKDKMWC